MKKYEILIETAQKLMEDEARVGRLTKEGPGKRNRNVSYFINKLSERSKIIFKKDFSKKYICGDQIHEVHFYFPDEGAIVNVSFALHRPNSELEKGVLKALMAKENKNDVKHVVFLAIPGALTKCRRKEPQAIIDWIREKHGIEISIVEMDNVAPIT
ncbi:MAG: hypothetical protein KKD35_03370 [Elusimicrobia bacterium]|nr:hypothetical protein [Elusimicrobiota bacterium]